MMSKLKIERGGRTLRFWSILLSAVVVGSLLGIGSVRQVAASSIGPDAEYSQFIQNLEPPRLDAPANQESNQLFQGDLRVERGQLIEGDTIVYSGNVWIESEAHIDGNLVVFSGNVEIEEGATVSGNVDLFSGNATIAGTVTGNLALWSGNVTLADSAFVGGDLSVLSGHIDRAPGAHVGGSLVEGPRFGFGNGDTPRIFGFNFGPERVRPVETVASGPLTFVQWVGAFLARLLGAVLLTGFVAVLVGLAVHVRPDAIARVRTRLLDKPALSFVIGFAVNLILAFLGGLLALTICLLPIALVPMLALLAINLLGWAVLAQLVGNRFESYVQRPMESWMSAAVGAVIITSVFALLWAFGGFFRFLGNGILLFTASFGAGAVLLPWVMRVLEPAKRTGAANQTGAAQSAAATPPPASVTPAPTGGFESPASAATTSPVTAPTITTPTPTTPIATGTEEAGTASLQESIEERLAAASEESIDTAPPDLDVSDIGGDAAGDAGAEQEDDFTELKGVGPVLDGRLKDAGIRTFRQLANLTAAEVAEIVGWSESRVASSKIVEQARDAAS